MVICFPAPHYPSPLVQSAVSLTTSLIASLAILQILKLRIVVGGLKVGWFLLSASYTTSKLYYAVLHMNNYWVVWLFFTDRLIDRELLWHWSKDV